MTHETMDCPPSQDVSDIALPFGPAFFRESFDNLYDGVYFVDCSRRILFWNRSAERLSSYKAEEIVGRYCHADILRHANESGCELCHDSCPLQQEIQGTCVTASFGVTQVTRHDDQASVLDRADRALYQAKRSGRNCGDAYRDK